MALAAFSPPLDPAGNTVRGQAALQSIIKELNLNLFRS
jgi:Glutaminase